MSDVPFTPFEENPEFPPPAPGWQDRYILGQDPSPAPNGFEFRPRSDFEYDVWYKARWIGEILLTDRSYTHILRGNFSVESVDIPFVQYADLVRMAQRDFEQRFYILQDMFEVLR